MFKKILVASCLLVTSIASQAALISFNGYERDSTSNIVKSGGLEWLMWSETRNKSINMALAENDGWTVATQQHIANLYNAFKFSEKNDWSGSGDAGQILYGRWSVDEEDSYGSFVTLFGTTYIQQCATIFDLMCFSRTDAKRSTSALFTSQEDVSKVAVADMADDYTHLWYTGNSVYNYDPIVMITGYYGGDYNYQNESLGVALVREVKSDITPVPLPNSISMLVLGLFALAVYRYQLLRFKPTQSSE